MKNATLPPSKRSRIEHQMDKMILLMFCLLFAMCLVGAALFALWTKNISPSMWYLAPDNAPNAFNPSKAVLSGVYAFVTSFVLYGYLIPISLYVSLEMVKVVQVGCSEYHPAQILLCTVCLHTEALC
jgi:magnesium-transporting ATPase (P-type)